MSTHKFKKPSSPPNVPIAMGRFIPGDNERLHIRKKKESIEPCNCKRCGKEFIPASHNQAAYCCKECANN